MEAAPTGGETASNENTYILAMKQMRMLPVIMLVSAIAIGGCSLKLRLEVFNNTDTPFDVFLQGNWISVAPNTKVQGFYPGHEESFELQLRREECVASIQLPDSLSSYFLHEEFEGTVYVQVEHDGSAFLVPSSMTLPADIKSLNLLEGGYRLEYLDCQQANGVSDK